jgi:hypothetical protein
MIKDRRKIKGYMTIDAYDIKDVTGNYDTYFEVYKGNKYIGIAMFR